MKLKFIRPVIAFCLTITLAFNSVSLAFAAPEDSYDLPLEIQQQQQERLLELLPSFYEKLATYDTELTRESNHKNLINEILKLKKDQEEQKAIIDQMKSIQSAVDAFHKVDLFREEIENIQSKLQELEEGQEQLQKALEFSIKNNQKQLQEALEASLENLKNEKMAMESKLNKLQDFAKCNKRSNKMFYSLISREITPYLQAAPQVFKDVKFIIYLFMKSKLPELVELFYEINNNNDYSSATYAQKKTELLKSLQDIIQELQRQEVERLQYQCNKQK